MKKIFYLLGITLLFSFSALAQNEGISFQGLARNAAGEVLVSQKISLRLSILLNSESGAVTYSETRQTTTNPQGIFSLVVGDGTATSKTGNFSNIDWSAAAKFIKVEMDANAGTNFTLMGTSKLQSVPFAYYAFGVDAENVRGIVPVSSGGTGVASIADLKASLGVDQVNNTTDASKPISTATQGALNTKVDKVNGKELSTNDYTTAEKAKLAAISGTNTGDQDLSAYATTLQLATKVDKEVGKGLSSNDFTTAEKTKLAAITGNVAGPVGPTGATGPAGAIGPQGLPGATGATGPAGATGPQGLPGVAGADGATGPTGATGPIGPAGLTWKGAWSATGTYAKDDAVGYNGASYFCLAPVSNSSATPTSDPTKWALLASQGATGLQGPTGPRGVKGATGPTGATGAAGPQGIQGLTGPTGATGPAGVQGIAGPIGPAGLTWRGAWSATGTYAKDDVVGFNGASYFCLVPVSSSSATPTSDPTKWALLASQGVDGPQGPAGAAGATGPQGPIGLTGPQGPTGAAGAQGLAGSDGAAGPQGATGLTGATGATGPAGLQGPIGLTGATGPAGPTGPAGVAGATGPAGPQGATGPTGLLSSGNAAGNTPYWDGTQWVVNSSNLFNNGSNLGIGTTSPSEKLDVAGNVKTSGTLTAGTVTYPNTHGSANQVLSTTGSGTLAWTTPSSGGAGVPYTGATGAVNLGGYDLTVNGLAIGTGKVNSSGTFNTIVGGSNVTRTFTSVVSNTAIGFNTLSAGTPGDNNTTVGAWSLVSNTGAKNSAMGVGALERNLGGNENTAIGYYALRGNTTGSNNTAIGYAADMSDGLSNATAIGSGATVAASNTIQLGNTSVTNVKTSGTITAGAVTYPKTDGTSGQVLTTNGSGTLSWASASSSSGVPYTGATQAVNLGVYDLTVNGLTVGSGKVGASGSSSNTIVGGSGDSRAFTSVVSNTAIGFNTLSSSTPGNSNTVVGAWSLVSNSGAENSAMGVAALERNLGGSGNTAIGYYSLRNNLTGSNNTALGHNSLIIDPPGSNNTMIGASADLGATNLTNATAIGYQAKVAASNTIQLGADGTNGTTAITNVKTSGTLTAGTVTYPNAHGTSGQVLTTNGSGILAWASASSSSGVPYTGATQAVNLGVYDLTVNGMTIGSGKINSTATLNTIVGEYALNRANTYRGTDNTAIGYKAMGNESASTTSAGTKNTAVGSWTLVGNSGQENSAVGVGALEQNQNGGQNTAMGGRALTANSTGSNNTALGYNSLKSNSTGSQNTTLGSEANVASGTLTNATAIGYGATVAASNTIQLGNTSVTNVNTSGSVTANDVKIGRGAGNVSTNTAVGTNALGSNTSGGNNTAVGNGALQTNATGGTGNTAVGRSALQTASTGVDNTALGYNALLGNTTGSNNVGIGVVAGANTTTGDYNISIGKQALQQNTTGSSNVAVGAGSIDQMTTGSNNAVLGGFAGRYYGTGMASNYTTTLNSSILIGYDTRPKVNNGSNEIVIGTSAIGNGSNTTTIGGDSNTDTYLKGNVHVSNALKISGGTPGVGKVLTSDANGLASWATPSAGISGTGTQNYVSKYGSGGTSLANSSIFDNGTSVGINTASPGSSFKLDVNGAANIASNMVVQGMTIGVGNSAAQTSNTVIGNAALSSNTTGYNNIAFGYESLKANTSGPNNVAVGWGALTANTNGGSNVAIGAGALNDLNGWSGNTAIGTSAGAFLNTENNTLIGFRAGSACCTVNTTNTGNIYIGVETGMNTNGSYNTFIGNSVYNLGTVSNNIILADGAGTIRYHWNGTTNNFTGTVSSSGTQLTSDLRLKSNISRVTNGLSTIMQLNPVHYLKKDSFAATAYTLEENGFIAQEIQKILPFLVKEGVDENKLLSIDYNSLIPILTKAIQEQQAQIEELQSYKSSISSLQKELEEIKKLLKGQEK